MQISNAICLFVAHCIPDLAVHKSRLCEQTDPSTHSLNVIQRSIFQNNNGLNSYAAKLVHSTNYTKHIYNQPTPMRCMVLSPCPSPWTVPNRQIGHRHTCLQNREPPPPACARVGGETRKQCLKIMYCKTSHDPHTPIMANQTRLTTNQNVTTTEHNNTQQSLTHMLFSGWGARGRQARTAHPMCGPLRKNGKYGPMLKRRKNTAPRNSDDFLLAHASPHPHSYRRNWRLSLTHSLTHSLTRSLTHSFTHSLAHSLIHSLSRSVAHSLTRALTSFTLLPVCYLPKLVELARCFQIFRFLPPMRGDYRIELGTVQDEFCRKEQATWSFDSSWHCCSRDLLFASLLINSNLRRLLAAPAKLHWSLGKENQVCFTNSVWSPHNVRNSSQLSARLYCRLSLFVLSCHQ